MTVKDLRAKYNNAKAAQAISRAVRAEIPGGSLLLDTLEIVSGRIQYRDRPSEQQVARMVIDDIAVARDMMRAEIAKRYELKDAGDVEYEPRYRVPPGQPERWYTPIFIAWMELSHLDYNRIDANAADFANEIKMRLQSIMSQIEIGLRDQ